MHNDKINDLHFRKGEIDEGVLKSTQLNHKVIRKHSDVGHLVIFCEFDLTKNFTAPPCIHDENIVLRYAVLMDESAQCQGLCK